MSHSSKTQRLSLICLFVNMTACAILPQTPSTRVIDTDAALLIETKTMANSSIPTNELVPTDTPTPSPTALPFAWKRISDGVVFERDSVMTIAADPLDPGIIYVGLRTAGIYKSIDGGTSWRPAHQGLNNTSVQTLQINPQNPQILYAATSGGLYKSTDGAEQWERINDAFDILMDPQDSQHIYARNQNAILETNNGGADWKTVLDLRSSFGSITYWAIDPRDGNSLLVSVPSGNRVGGYYLSEDGGRSWKLVFSARSGLFVAIGRDASGNRVLYADLDFGVQVSYDNGATWSTKNMICNSPITVDPSSPWIVYCPLYAPKPTQIARSTDSGRTWRILSGQQIDIQSIAVSHLDGTVRIIAGGKGVKISLDNGSSWQQHDNGLAAARSNLSIDPANASKFFLAAYYDRWEGKCTLYRSLDSGQNWSVLLYGGSPSLVWSRFQPRRHTLPDECRIPYRSLDGGTRWNPM